MKGMKISVQKTTLAFFWRMDCGGGGASKSEGRETRSGCFWQHRSELTLMGMRSVAVERSGQVQDTLLA